MNKIRNCTYTFFATAILASSTLFMHLNYMGLFPLMQCFKHSELTLWGDFQVLKGLWCHISWMCNGFEICSLPNWFRWQILNHLASNFMIKSSHFLASLKSNVLTTNNRANRVEILAQRTLYVKRSSFLVFLNNYLPVHHKLRISYMSTAKQWHNELLSQRSDRTTFNSWTYL
jgi:hypothetical protein